MDNPEQSQKVKVLASAVRFQCLYFTSVMLAALLVVFDVTVVFIFLFSSVSTYSGM